MTQELKKYLKSAMTNQDYIDLKSTSDKMDYKYKILFKKYYTCLNSNIDIYYSNDLNEFYTKYKLAFYEVCFILDNVKPFFDIDGCTLQPAQVELYIHLIIKEIYGNITPELLIGYREKEGKMSYRVIAYNLKIKADVFYQDMIRYKLKIEQNKNSIDNQELIHIVNQIDKSVYTNKRILRNIFSLKTINSIEDGKNSLFKFYNFKDNIINFERSLLTAFENAIPITRILKLDDTTVIKVNKLSLQNLRVGPTLVNLTPSLVIIKRAIEEFIERKYNNINKINLSFDGQDFLLTHHWRNGQQLICLCGKSTSQGNIKFKINYNNMVTACCINTVGSGCLSYIDITNEINIKKDLLIQYSTEIFNNNQSEYLNKLYDFYPILGRLTTYEITNTNPLKLKYNEYNTILQMGKAGYGKTNNFINCIQQIQKSGEYKFCYIIVNLTIQNQDMITRLADVFECNKVKDFHYINEERRVRIRSEIHSKNININKRDITEQKEDSYFDIIIFNAKSLVEFDVDIDVLFIDEFIQVHKSQSDPKEKRIKSLNELAFQMIKNAKLLFINDIVFDKELINMLNICGREDILIYQILKSHMTFNNVLVTDEVEKLYNLIKSDVCKFVFCDNRHFLEFLYNLTCNMYGEENCLIIVGKKESQTEEERTEEVNLKLSIAHSKKYVFASPAIMSAVSIMGKRIIIGIKLHDFLPMFDIMNALNRARDAKDMYIFPLYGVKKRNHMTIINENMSPENQSSFKYIDNMENKSFKDILYQFLTLVDTSTFYEYYSYNDVLFELYRLFCYQPKYNKDPKIQIWRSSNFGFKLVDFSRTEKIFNIIMKKKILGLNIYKYFDLVNRKDKYSFELTIDGGTYTYKFEGIEEILNELNKYIDMIEFIDFQIEMSLEVENSIDELIQSKKEIYKSNIFFDRFYNIIKTKFNQIKRIININTNEVSGSTMLTQNDIQSKNKIQNTNQYITNYFYFIRKFESEARIHQASGDINQLVQSLYKCYCVGTKANRVKFGKKIITIWRNNIEMINITNHNQDFITNLNKIQYNDEEVKEMLIKYNIKFKDPMLGNIIHYVKTVKREGSGKRLNKLTLTRLNCSDIKFELCHDNN